MQIVRLLITVVNQIKPEDTMSILPEPTTIDH